jgi:hypothetical protein
MNTIEFISFIKDFVEKSAINTVKTNITAPAGRQPQKKYVIMSEWYNRQEESDKEHVDLIIKEAVHSAIFKMLTVLDGVTSLGKEFSEGEFKLYYKDEETLNLINNPNNEYLHDLFNEASK